MWAYYAADEQGVAFRYELYPEDLLCCCENHCNKCILATIAPVQYGQLPDMSRLSHVLNGSSALTDYPEATSYMCLVNTAFHKTMDWEHEKEWRVVSGTCPSSDKPLYLCARPTAVFLGRLIDPANENDVLILAEELKIPAYKMKRSEEPDGRFEAVPAHCIDS